MAKSGMRVMDRLQKHGILGERTVVANAIHIDAREVELLAGSGTWVSHQPRSNMNNGEITTRTRELVPDVWKRYQTFVPED